MTDNILKIACAGLGIAQIELAERIDNSVLHHIVQRADFTITIANTFLVWGGIIHSLYYDRYYYILQPREKERYRKCDIGGIAKTKQ